MRRLLQLEHEAFPQDAWDRALLESYAKNGSLFLVALVDGRFAGYCIVRQSRVDAAELDSIAVFRRFRRHGVGSALLKSATGRLRRRGVTTLGLMVRRDNVDAIAFYRLHGFRRVRTVPSYYEDGATAWRMTAHAGPPKSAPVIA